MNEPIFTHLDGSGNAHMVDISAKPISTRVACAQAVFHTTAEVITAIVDHTMPKGDVLATARIAGIMAAKRTSDLIPLCHPLAITKVTIDFTCAVSSITVCAQVGTTGKTGVEMEALTAVSIAALTLHDMTKASDPFSRIDNIHVSYKTGGTNNFFSSTS